MYMRYIQDIVLPSIDLPPALRPYPQVYKVSPLFSFDKSLFRGHRFSRFHLCDVSQPQSLSMYMDAAGKKKKRNTGSGLALTFVYLESG